VSVGGHLLRIADLIDRQERKARVVVHDVVEPPRPQAVAGDDPVAMAGLAATGHHAGLHEVHDRIGNDVAVDAEVTAVGQMAQRLVGHPTEPDLQRRAILDDRGDVARHSLCDLAGFGMTILRQWGVDADQRIEAVEVDEALAVRARHRRVDLGDHATRHAQDCRRKVHGHAEADEASDIGWRDLEQGDVDRQQPARQEHWHLLEGDRHVIELSAAREIPHVAADEERPMAIAAMGSARLLRQRRRSDEAHELEVGRAREHRLEPGDQAARRGATGAEIDAAARPDRRQSLLGADELRAEVDGVLAGHLLPFAPSHWPRDARPHPHPQGSLDSPRMSIPRECRAPGRRRLPMPPLGFVGLKSRLGSLDPDLLGCLLGAVTGCRCQ
jgi:hypothetical protein